ncbi:hypothetical protein GCM10023325_14890 [Sphingomonas lutea]
MLAALATLVFLSTLWLLAVLVATVLEHSGGKIAAAFKGQLGRSIAQPAPYARLRVRSRLPQPMRARPRWRDAA